MKSTSIIFNKIGRGWRVSSAGLIVLGTWAVFRIADSNAAWGEATIRLDAGTTRPDSKSNAIAGLNRAEAAGVKEPDNDKRRDWQMIEAAVGGKGKLQGDVFTVTLPRKDVDVRVDGMEILPGALLSTFHFHHCPCGKLIITGDFCVIDYEANDVMDALRAGGMRIASVGGLFVGDKPHLLSIRFHGEAHGEAAVKPIQEALKWIGEARSAPKPAKEQ